LHETLQTNKKRGQAEKTSYCSFRLLRHCNGEKAFWNTSKKPRPKKKPVSPSVQRYVLFPPRKTAFSGEGGELFMPTFTKGQKSARKKLGFTAPTLH
jgi:hypothetical protein